MNRPLSILVIIFSIIIIQSCEDKPVLPSVTTTIATEISATSAVSGGNITDDGGAQIITGGVCWNTSENLTTEGSRTIEGGKLSSFSSNISQLTPNTTYYVRAYAINSVGTGYGKSLSFKTLGDKPSLSNLNASKITINSTTLNGSVNAIFLPTTVTFEYGLTSSYGNTVTNAQNPVTGNSNVNVTADITGLAPGTTYHFRIKTENSLGITYSSDMTFTTLGKIPSVTSKAVTNLQMTQARINGVVNPNYLPTTVLFEWGTTTSFGNTIDLTQNPIDGNSSVNVFTDLSGLSPMTTYYFRIKATNELGTSFGEILTFKTFAAIDADGNGYYSVQIGSQTWLTENLKTTKFLNGDIIGTTIPATKDVLSESAPNYQWAPNGIESNVDIYGRLYSWYAVIDIRHLCPTGWSIPTDTEWTILTDFLTNNGYGIDGSGNDIAKSMAAKTGWNPSEAMSIISNDPGNNSSGFTALPAGYRFGGDRFTTLGYVCTWWTSSEQLASTALYRELYNSVSFINIGITVKSASACSIRCIKK